MRAPPPCVMPPPRALGQLQVGDLLARRCAARELDIDQKATLLATFNRRACELFGTSMCDPRAVGTVPAHMSRFAGDAAARGDGAPKVSVVVPVFDPGP